VIGAHYPARIGLTAYRERAVFGVWDEPADLLPSSYADAIHAVGGLPLLLPAVEGLDDDALSASAEVAIDGVHGLLISGGPDVDPGRYDAEREDATGAPHSARDRWEIALLMAALRRDLPILGVCRGMQVMAVALGGTLHQHLPDTVGDESHRPVVGIHGRHDVRLAPGSRIAGLVGASAEVATYHHQAVDRLPERITPNGWADDGTVEAIEICDAGWALGVQWHPEVHDGGSLFAAFVAAAVAWRDEQAGDSHQPANRGVLR
jgi:gamma-glutamyl-gamma-aminobutyrate hydrolase PuuD